MGISGTLTHDQTNPWEQENKKSNFVCASKISRTFIHGLSFVPVTQWIATFGLEHCACCFILLRVQTSFEDCLLCFCVWNITGCRNLAMELKLLVHRRKDGDVFTVGWRQRNCLNYFQEMCKFKVIIFWDVVPYSAKTHQRFRLILCFQWREEYRVQNKHMDNGDTECDR
jgi:hypothetical protein